VAVQLVRSGYLGLTVTAPDDVLRDQQRRAQLSARRFALLGGSATALLLGFAAVGAIGLRRDHATLVELLRRRGAGRFRAGHPHRPGIGGYQCCSAPSSEHWSAPPWPGCAGEPSDCPLWTARPERCAVPAGVCWPAR